MKNWYMKALVLTAGGIIVFLVVQRAQENKVIKAASATLDSDPSDVQKDSIRQIVRAWRKFGDGDKRKLAYILATARHESRFRPIKEYRASATRQPQLYEIQNRYWYSGYYGRGFVQLTWERNYAKMSEFLGVDLVKNPDLALDPYYAAQILVYGMVNGSFTRRNLEEFIPKNGTADYYNARKIVNGTDKASLIKDYAIKIENLL